MNDQKLPERINVSKVISYHVDDIVNMLRADLGREPDFDDVISQIEEWAKDDFSCGWGHEARIKELIFTNQNGEEL